MAARIFLRDVGGCRAGQIEDLDWSAFEQSVARHHGVHERLDEYAIPVEDAARLYVAALNSQPSNDGHDRLAVSRTAARDESRRPR